MMHTKIGLIGAGNVGMETANVIIQKNIGDCILFDIDNDMTRGKGLDLTHSTPIRHASGVVKGGVSFEELQDCEVVVVTAGMPRKPGMTRDDLLEANSKTMKEVAENLNKYASDSIKIVVTNPLDTMTYLIWKLTGMDNNKTIGMAGLLDATRFRAFLAMKLGVSAEDINAIVIGSHGDFMIPSLDLPAQVGFR